MTPQDFATYVATGAAVISAVYGIVAYHRPKEAPATKPLPKSRKPNSQPPIATRQKSFFWPMVLMLVSWGAVGFNFIDRHWLADREPAEVPLSQENARLEITPHPLWQDATKSFYMNFELNNAGKNTAMQEVRYGLATGAPGTLDPDLIDAYFVMAKAKLKKAPPGDNEYPPGPTGQFFSIPGIAPGLQFVTDENYEAAKIGKLLIYALVVERYRDTSLDSGKFIYTERCIYLAGAVVHNCEHGHNHSYISD